MSERTRLIHADGTDVDTEHPLPTSGGGGGGGGGGGAITAADGALVDGSIATIGKKADAAVTAINTTPMTLVGGIRGIVSKLFDVITALGGLLTDTQLRATPVPVSGDLTATVENPAKKAHCSVLTGATLDLALASATTRVDIMIDCAPDVYMGFAPTSTDSAAAAYAPYKLKAGNLYSLDVKAASSLHLYFATAGSALGASDYIRIQEWGG